MERFPALTRTRLKQLAGDMKALIYPQLHPVKALLMAGSTDRISYDAAQKLNYKPVKLGQPLGPLWYSYWFHIETDFPAEWAGKRIDLLWNSLSEATLWLKGKPVQGLNFPYGERPDAVLTEKASVGQKLSFYVEMACNTSYGNWLEDKSPHAQPFSLERCEIALFDPVAWEMYLDFVVLQELQAELAGDNGPSEMAFEGELLFELNRFANEFDLNDKSTWTKAHKILKELYKRRNASTAHMVSAVGHGHLDTAWLWPIAETYRKCLRTWTNQLAIMDAYSDYKFAFSAAFHYQIIKESYPQVYQKVKEKAKGGQWLPVGGTWVEPDCNMPSGESLIRQFLFGQRFFVQEFGKRCREFFNPDVFGYSGQLPQIMKLAGIDYFLTSKLHENELNKPDNHTFIWQGIDGSEVLTHFPPLRFFTVPATVADMRGVLKRFRDHDRSARSIVLYGHGDGGGGPTKEMVERMRRYQDLQGLPKTEMSSPQEFFAAIDPLASTLPRQVGEIYFEYHRGTYTTQAWIKKANRRAEFLLHDLEFLSALAFKTQAIEYPQEELERLWKLLLVNQMHDILPGSSIGQVYEDARKDFAQIQVIGQQIKEEMIQVLINGDAQAGKTRVDAIHPYEAGTHASAPAISQPPVRANMSVTSTRRGTDRTRTGLRQLEITRNQPNKPGTKGSLEKAIEKKSDAANLIPINTTSFERHEVSTTPDGRLVIVNAPAYGIGEILQPEQLKSSKSDKLTAAATATESGNKIVLENSYLRAEFNKTGELTSLVEKNSKREVISGAGNRLQIFADKPAVYDAWQLELYHLETAKDCPAAHKYSIVSASINSKSHSYSHESKALRAEVKFEREIGEHSSMTQIVRLDAQSRRLEFHCQCEWHEDHKVLKVLFPVNVRAMDATYEIQFGAIERPTHFNTPYDLAKFEVCGHKWSDLSEHNFGVALLTESKYGFSTFANEMRITLLRAPKLPDNQADIGVHEFSYAIMPHTGSWQEAGVVAEAYKFNQPITWGQSMASPVVHSYFSLNDNNLVLDTIKKAEDSNALVLRLYESHGARGTARLQTSLPFSKAVFCNALEDEIGPVRIIDGQLELPYSHFRSYRLS